MLLSNNCHQDLLTKASFRLGHFHSFPVSVLLHFTYLFTASALVCQPLAVDRAQNTNFKGEGRWGTSDDFTTSFLHFSLFSTALWDLANCRPGHSLMLSSHLFLCPPCLLPPLTVPCKMVLARPDERGKCPYHCSLRLFTMSRLEFARYQLVNLKSCYSFEYYNVFFVNARLGVTDAVQFGFVP